MSQQIVLGDQAPPRPAGAVYNSSLWIKGQGKKEKKRTENNGHKGMKSTNVSSFCCTWPLQQYRFNKLRKQSNSEIDKISNQKY